MSIKAKIASFIGYIIPIFGWMIPLYFFKKDEDASFHARQSFLLTVSFILNLVLMFFIDKSMPIQYDYLSNIFWLFLVFLYLCVSILCAVKIVITGRVKLPLINELASRLPL